MTGVQRLQSWVVALGLLIFIIVYQAVTIPPTWADEVTEIIDENLAEFQAEKEASQAAQNAFDQMDKSGKDRTVKAAAAAGQAAGAIMREFARNNDFYSASQAGEFAGMEIMVRDGYSADAVAVTVGVTMAAGGTLVDAAHAAAALHAASIALEAEIEGEAEEEDVVIRYYTVCAILRKGRESGVSAVEIGQALAVGMGEFVFDEFARGSESLFNFDFSYGGFTPEEAGIITGAILLTRPPRAYLEEEPGLTYERQVRLAQEALGQKDTRLNDLVNDRVESAVRGAAKFYRRGNDDDVLNAKRIIGQLNLGQDLESAGPSSQDQAEAEQEEAEKESKEDKKDSVIGALFLDEERECIVRAVSYQGTAMGSVFSAVSVERDVAHAYVPYDQAQTGIPEACMDFLQTLFGGGVRECTAENESIKCSCGEPSKGVPQEGQESGQVATGGGEDEQTQERPSVPEEEEEMVTVTVGIKATEAAMSGEQGPMLFVLNIDPEPGIPPADRERSVEEENRGALAGASKGVVQPGSETAEVSVPADALVAGVEPQIELDRVEPHTSLNVAFERESLSGLGSSALATNLSGLIDRMVPVARAAGSGLPEGLQEYQQGEGTKLNGLLVVELTFPRRKLDEVMSQLQQVGGVSYIEKNQCWSIQPRLGNEVLASPVSYPTQTLYFH